MVCVDEHRTCAETPPCRRRGPYFYRQTVTRPEFEHHLESWTNQDAYPLLYLCFHGRPSGIHLKGEVVDLDGIAQKIGAHCQGRIIHFSSCRTFNLSEKRLQNFLDTTGGLAISGYRKSVNWMESATFELLYLSALCGADAWTSQSITSVGTHMMERYGEMTRRLAFHLSVNPKGEAAKKNTTHSTGDIVKARYEGQVYEPCQILAKKGQGRATRYTVYFDVDQTSVEGMKDADIVGPSNKPMVHLAPPAGYRAGDIVKALYDGVEYEPCRVENVQNIRGQRRYKIYFDVDQTTVARMTDEDITGYSSRPLTSL